jgi:hypothetical protein
VTATKAAIDRELDADYPQLEALYKDIHSHPELGFEAPAPEREAPGDRCDVRRTPAKAA